ncbi:MAG TPA: TRAP transporter substrate-binding protein DctP [Desulfobacteria bacterium]|nr:TRAP transporter substrate-binding protein DctP [Desulfobacteria bacterium]
MIFSKKLKAATAFNNAALNDGFQLFCDRIKTRGGIKLKLVGGAGIPPFELLQALRTGKVDIINITSAYYISQLPEADALKLSTLSPEQERACGFYDYMNKLHQERVNAYYLGRNTPLVTQHLYMTTEITEPDLEGMPIRVTGAQSALVQALGAAAITTAPSELPTALKLGIVSGYGWPAIGVDDLMQEETKFVIDPGFYQFDAVTLINLDTWRRITPEQQKLLAETMRETEQLAADHYRKKMADTRQQMRRKGVKEITFSPEMVQKYLNTAYTSGWKQLLDASPQLAPKIKELLGGDRL